MERRRDSPHAEHRAQFCQSFAPGEAPWKIVRLGLLGPGHDAVSFGPQNSAQALLAAFGRSLRSVMEPCAPSAPAEQVTRNISAFAGKASTLFDGLLFLRHAFSRIRALSF